jgi:dienelactone hydrolase
MIRASVTASLSAAAALVFAACAAPQAAAAPASLPPEWERFLAAEVAKIESSFENEVRTREDWMARRGQFRQELGEMLGLHPEPPRGDLRAEVAGIVEGDDFVVEKLHFQPVPRLYVAANFYRPKNPAGKLPTILYLSGHGRETGADGRSNGNKTHYQAHGRWFARHGCNCLILDTVQWGEFLGEHWGTYKLNRWWWLCRGYTPAGVETWSGMRALDYLASRADVDMEKIGCTGRSGGGAYTWFVTAMDDRVRVACPTAGITTLRDHILTGCVEGHCDCMFMNNIHRWDFDKVAALAAPRPLCILNTDKDDIFPLGGVMRIYNSTRRLYALLGAEKNIGLQIAEGPHHDSQPLNFGAFHWFNRFLKGADALDVIDEPARSTLNKDELRVFRELPGDEIDTSVDELFVPAFSTPPVPENKAQWGALKAGWMRVLQEKIFAYRPEGAEAEAILRAPPENHHLLRRLALLGLTWDGLQVGRMLARPDILANNPGPAEGNDAINRLYALILSGKPGELSLRSAPVSHRQGPVYFSILRHFDIPQAVAMAAENSRITLTGNPDDWKWAVQTAEKMGFADHLKILPEMQLAEVKKIWDGAPHCAFTDLLRQNNGDWLCVFREGSGHVPGSNGCIRVLASPDGERWESAALISEAGVDLRDPKICRLSDGRLMLTIGGSRYDGQESDTAARKFLGGQTRVSFSTDGRTWTPPQAIAREQSWLWRSTPMEDGAYAASYSLPENADQIHLELWRAKDGTNWQPAGRPDPGRQCWPSEATLRFLPDKTLLALVRNERPAGRAFLGSAKPPYANWSWMDTGRLIQGPNFIRLSDGRLCYAGRDVQNGKPVTAVGRLSPDGHATQLLVLPSGGDTSYPGMEQAPDGRLWVSYYSSHEGKTAIYLAKITLAR